MSPALTLRNVAGFGLALLFACDVLAAVGSVQFVVGDVKVRDAAGKVRAAQKGEAIDEGDAILTGSSGSTQLKMSDGGILAVRPETELKIDTYRFTGKEDGTENALMSLVKGGFRTITGIIGRTNKTNYRVNTGTATIGIRGTAFTLVVLPQQTTDGSQTYLVRFALEEGAADISGCGADAIHLEAPGKAVTLHSVGNGVCSSKLSPF